MDRQENSAAYERLAQRLEDESQSVRKMLQIQNEISSLRRSYDPIAQDPMVSTLMSPTSFDIGSPIRQNVPVAASGINARLLVDRMLSAEISRSTLDFEREHRSDSYNDMTVDMIASHIALAREESTPQKFDVKFWKQRTLATLKLAESLQKELSSCRKENAHLNEMLRQSKLDFQNQLARISSDITQSKIAAQQELEQLRRDRDRYIESNEKISADLKDCQRQMENEGKKVQHLMLSQSIDEERKDKEYRDTLKQARSDWDVERNKELDELKEKVKRTIRELEQRHKDDITTLANAWQTEKLALIKDIEQREEKLSESQVAFLREKSTFDSDRVVRSLKRVDEALLESLKSKEFSLAAVGPPQNKTDPECGSSLEKHILELEQELDAARLEIGIRTRNAESSLRRAELREELLTSTQAELASAQKRIDILEIQTRTAELQQQKRDKSIEVISKLEEEVARLNAQIVSERLNFKGELEERNQECEDSLEAMKREMESKLASVAKHYEEKVKTQLEGTSTELKRAMSCELQVKEDYFAQKVIFVANQMLATIDSAISSLLDEFKAASSVVTFQVVNEMEERICSNTPLSPITVEQKTECVAQPGASPTSNEFEDWSSDSSIASLSDFFPDASGSSPFGAEVDQKLANKIIHLENLTNAAASKVKDVIQRKSGASNNRNQLTTSVDSNCPTLIISEVENRADQDIQSKLGKFESALGIPRSLARHLEKAFLEEDEYEVQLESAEKRQMENSQKLSTTGVAKSKQTKRTSNEGGFCADAVKEKKGQKDPVKRSVNFKLALEPDNCFEDIETKILSLKDRIKEYSQLSAEDPTTSKSKADSVYEQFVNIASSYVSTLNLCTEAVRTFANARASLIKKSTQSCEAIEQMQLYIQELQDRENKKDTEVLSLRLQTKTLNQELLTTKQFAEEAKTVARQSTEAARHQADMAFQQVAERIKIASKEAYDRALAEAESVRVKDQLQTLTEQTSLNLKIRELQIELERCQKESESLKKEVEKDREKTKELFSECTKNKAVARQHEIEVDRMNLVIREKNDTVDALKRECKAQQHMASKCKEEVERIRLEAQKEISSKTADAEMRAHKAESLLSITQVELTAQKVRSESELKGLRDQIVALTERERERERIKDVVSNCRGSHETLEAHYRYEEIERQANENNASAQREIQILKQTIEHLRREMEDTVSAFSANARTEASSYTLQIQEAKSDAWKRARLNFELELSASERRAAVAVRRIHELWINYIRRFMKKKDRLFEKLVQNLLLESETKVTQWLAKTRIGTNKCADIVRKMEPYNLFDESSISESSLEDICGTDISGLVKEIVDNALQGRDSDFIPKGHYETLERDFPERFSAGQALPEQKNNSQNESQKYAPLRKQSDPVSSLRKGEFEIIYDEIPLTEVERTEEAAKRILQSDETGSNRSQIVNTRKKSILQKSLPTEIQSEEGLTLKELKDAVEAEKVLASSRDYNWQQEVQARLHRNGERLIAPRINSETDEDTDSKECDKYSVMGDVMCEKPTKGTSGNQANRDEMYTANPNADPKKDKVMNCKKKDKRIASKNNLRIEGTPQQEQELKENAKEEVKALPKRMKGKGRRDPTQVSDRSEAVASYKNKGRRSAVDAEDITQSSSQSANYANVFLTPDASLTDLERRVNASKVEPTPPSRLSKAFVILGPTPCPVTINDDGHWKFK